MMMMENTALIKQQRCRRQRQRESNILLKTIPRGNSTGTASTAASLTTSSTNNTGRMKEDPYDDGEGGDGSGFFSLPSVTDATCSTSKSSYDDDDDNNNTGDCGHFCDAELGDSDIDSYAYEEDDDESDADQSIDSDPGARWNVDTVVNDVIANALLAEEEFRALMNDNDDGRERRISAASINAMNALFVFNNNQSSTEVKEERSKNKTNDDETIIIERQCDNAIRRTRTSSMNAMNALLDFNRSVGGKEEIDDVQMERKEENEEEYAYMKTAMKDKREDHEGNAYIYDDTQEEGNETYNIDAVEAEEDEEDDVDDHKIDENNIAGVTAAPFSFSNKLFRNDAFYSIMKLAQDDSGGGKGNKTATIDNTAAGTTKQAAVKRRASKVSIEDHHEDLEQAVERRSSKLSMEDHHEDLDHLHRSSCAEKEQEMEMNRQETESNHPMSSSASNEASSAVTATSARAEVVIEEERQYKDLVLEKEDGDCDGYNTNAIIEDGDFDDDDNDECRNDDDDDDDELSEIENNKSEPFTFSNKLLRNNAFYSIMEIAGDGSIDYSANTDTKQQDQQETEQQELKSCATTAAATSLLTNEDGDSTCDTSFAITSASTASMGTSKANLSSPLIMGIDVDEGRNNSVMSEDETDTKEETVVNNRIDEYANSNQSAAAAAAAAAAVTSAVEYDDTDSEIDEYDPILIETALEQCYELKKMATSKFNRSDIDGARMLYSNGLDLLHEFPFEKNEVFFREIRSMVASLYSNRAVTFYRANVFVGTVKDCNRSLKLDPYSEKTYVRKWRALEAMACSKSGDTSTEQLQLQQEAINCLKTGVFFLPNSKKLNDQLRKSLKPKHRVSFADGINNERCRQHQHPQQYSNRSNNNIAIAAAASTAKFITIHEVISLRHSLNEKERKEIWYNDPTKEERRRIKKEIDDYESLIRSAKRQIEEGEGTSEDDDNSGSFTVPLSSSTPCCKKGKKKNYSNISELQSSFHKMKKKGSDKNNDNSTKKRNTTTKRKRVRTWKNEAFLETPSSMEFMTQMNEHRQQQEQEQSSSSSSSLSKKAKFFLSSLSSSSSSSSRTITSNNKLSSSSSISSSAIGGASSSLSTNSQRTKKARLKFGAGVGLPSFLLRGTTGANKNKKQQQQQQQLKQQR